MAGARVVVVLGGAVVGGVVGEVAAVIAAVGAGAWFVTVVAAEAVAGLGD